jgi:hypothetical protein
MNILTIVVLRLVRIEASPSSLRSFEKQICDRGHTLVKVTRSTYF